MPLNVPHTSCSTTYCRNMKRMICRHCSLDPQQTRNTKVDAWHLTNMEPGKALRPMPSNSPDPHAYLCDECLQTWNKQTPPPAKATHISDEEFTEQPEQHISQRKRKKIQKRKINQRLADAKSEEFSIKNHTTGETRNAFIRVVSNKDPNDSQNHLLLHFMIDFEKAIMGAEFNELFVENEQIRVERIKALAHQNGNEYMAVAFLSPLAGENPENEIPAAAIIFSVKSNDKNMQIDMRDVSEPIDVLKERKITIDAAGMARLKEQTKKQKTQETTPETTSKTHHIENKNSQPTIHIDQVYTDPKYARNSLSLKIIQFIQNNAPPDLVYMGLYTSMENRNMQAVAKKAGMRPNVSIPPKGYAENGFVTSYVKPMPPLPTHAYT